MNGHTECFYFVFLLQFCLLSMLAHKLLLVLSLHNALVHSTCIDNKPAAQLLDRFSYFMVLADNRLIWKERDLTNWRSLGKTVHRIIVKCRLMIIRNRKLPSQLHLLGANNSFEHYRHAHTANGRIVCEHQSKGYKCKR